MAGTPLFDQREPFDRARLASRLAGLAAQGILIGTSSWKYPGWIGQVYQRERYLWRGVHAEKRFEAGCLDDYARTFPIVCGDFTFYQFPSPANWKKLFTSAPASLRYVFKAPEEITAKIFPTHPRYGARGGTANGSFLDAALFEDAFLAPLAPYRQQVAAVVFEFGTFSRAAYPGVRDFVRDLDRFLAALPRQVRYSVEIRNPEFLEADYFRCLRDHGVAHVFNSWSRMPDLRVQAGLTDAHTTDFLVCRALLRPGRRYEDAVRLFSPYEEIRDQYPEGRQALRDLISSAVANHRSAFIFVNNRFEGNAPATIEGIVD